MKEQYKTSIKYLNLDQIAASGQCFRWKKTADHIYEIPAFHKVLRVCQQGEEFTFFCREEEFHEIWEDYLDLSGSYETYLQAVDKKDTFLQAAAAYGSGIRILRQEPWETAVSFIISQCNNIPRIKGCIEKLCVYFGEDGYHFPTAERLAGLEGEELQLFQTKCSLGYRDAYILELARKVVDGTFDLEGCGQLPYEKCVCQLRTLNGVGQKVADCIALYGFHKIDAFPIDVHMKQILYQYYYSSDLEKLPKSRQLKTMVENHFSQYAGYRGIVQQWMFAYDLGR